MELHIAKLLLKSGAARFPPHSIKPRRRVSNSHVSARIYGGVPSAAPSSVISSTALFLQPSALHLHPGCWTILNQILRWEIPSNRQSPFLFLSTPPLQPPSGSRGILQVQAIAGLIQRQFHLHHAFLLLSPYIL